MKRKATKRVKPLRITVDWLRSVNACTLQMRLFAERYPTGVLLTKKNLIEAGDFDLDFLAAKLLDDKNRGAFVYETGGSSEGGSGEARMEFIGILWRHISTGKIRPIEELRAEMESAGKA